MEAKASDPVLICGAGPVGLALALGLSRHGVRSIVFERKPKLSEHSRALLITTRTLEILRQWGVLESFLSAKELRSELSLHMVGRSEPELTFDFEALKPVATVQGVMVLPQDRTEMLLLEEVRKAGVEVHFGYELRNFRQDETGVTAIVEGYSEQKEFRGSYLAGCDGAHSAVRERLGWPLEGKTYPSRMVLIDVRVPDKRSEVPWPLLSPQARGVLVGVQYAPFTWRIISTIAPGESDETALSHASIEAKVNRLFGPGPFETIWSSVFRLHCRTSPHFRLGRVILAGDAAHLNSPAGGQGMNSGIHDAHNLAWKLARAIEGGNAEALLDSYEQERREAVLTNVDRFTDLLTRLAFLPFAQIRFALLQFAKTMLGSAEARARILPQFAMLTTRYRRSVLLDDRSGHAGKRAPDVDLEDSNGRHQPLYMVAPSKAVLILFDDRRLPGWEPAMIKDALAEVRDLEVVRVLRPEFTAKAPGEWRDLHGFLWQKLHASGEMAVLLRPDGHIGWSRTRPSVDELRAGVRRALGA